MSDKDLLNIFWVEVGEYLGSLNGALLQVETTPTASRATLLREMNRVAHSMKGAARAVGVNVIETIAHYMEEIFGAVQEDRLDLSPDICDTLYDGLDVIQSVMGGGEVDKELLGQVLAHLEQTIALTALKHDDAGQEGTPPEDEHKSPTSDSQTLKAVTPDLTAPTIEASPAPRTPIHKRTITSELTALSASALAELSAGDSQTMILRPAEETIRVTVPKLDRLMAEASELLVARMHAEERHRQIVGLRRQIARWLREWRSVRAAYIRLVRRVTGGHEHELAAELTALFRFLESNARSLAETSRTLSALSQVMAQDNMHLSTLADQLQDDISAMRMVPFETVVGGFHRMVRDLARDVNKQVHLDVSSSAVEVDKTVLDALKDPIMHLLRNAVDHAIESPDEREAHGKSATGHVQLSVEQHGGEIIVQVSDDGRGIDAERVRRAAVKARLISEVEVKVLSDDEAYLLIFQSGLSTSDKVTAISGRGIGMDIVRERVESLRGRVSLRSAPGKGTQVSLIVPVSLTRIRCILLQVGAEHYAIPSNMVVRMQKVRQEEIFSAEGREMIVINERPTPLASLGVLLDVPAAPRSPDALSSVLVLRAADRLIAFEVDDLYSEQEVVLKSLGTEIANARYIAGAALLGSGEVIIVLDANDLVRGATGANLPARRTTPAPSLPKVRRVRVLVVDDSITTRTLEKNILETVGFEVMVAIDGVEAWRILNENDLDVVISDVEMPNMNGLELTRRIKSSAQTRDIPVILLTSLGKPEQREAGMRAGADAYLVKSRFDQGELLQTIQAVL